MSSESPSVSIARIEQALSRIEAASSRAPDTRYDRLRGKVEQALTSLDTVIDRLSATKADG